MKAIEELLFEKRDTEYAAFQAKLTPSVDSGLFIGVRVPEVRKLARQLKDEPMTADFIRELPHKYYDENMLQSSYDRIKSGQAYPAEEVFSELRKGL